MERARPKPTVVESLRSPGTCDKFPIEKSPWAYPAIPRHVERKVAYCQRQIALLRKWFAQTSSNDVNLWFERIEWIKQGKL